VIYNFLNQPQKACDLLEQSYTLKGTFLTENHIKEMTLMQMQFETRKKDKAISEQQIRLKKNEVKLLETQNQTIFALGGIFLLALLSLGTWLCFRQRQRIKDKEIITLQQQQEITKLESLIDGEKKSGGALRKSCTMALTVITCD
jgi:two-component system NarL family sensor kinase